MLARLMTLLNTLPASATVLYHRSSGQQLPVSCPRGSVVEDPDLDGVVRIEIMFTPIEWEADDLPLQLESHGANLVLTAQIMTKVCYILDDHNLKLSFCHDECITTYTVLVPVNN